MEELYARVTNLDPLTIAAAVGNLIVGVWALAKSARGVVAGCGRLARLFRPALSPLCLECLTALDAPDAEHDDESVYAGGIAVYLGPKFEERHGQIVPVPPHEMVQTGSGRFCRLAPRELRRVQDKARAVRDRLQRDALALAEAQAVYELRFIRRREDAKQGENCGEMPCSDPKPPVEPRGFVSQWSPGCEPLDGK